MLAHQVKDSIDPVGTTIKAINNVFASSVSTINSDDNGIALKVDGIYVLTGAGSKAADAAYTSNTSATRTTAAVDSVCTPDGSTDYTNFDTDSTKFYYDTTNHVSDVSRLDNASQVPTIVPQLAGAGNL